MESLWFILSLASAFLMASNAAFLKRYFSDITSWEMAVIPFFYATPFCLVMLLGFVEIPVITTRFWLHFAWVLPLTTIAMVMHFRAVHMSPLSLTMPFLAFTPVFVILTGQLMLGETLGSMGIVGILLVVAGGYIINIDAARYGALGPIRAIFREPGSAMMLFVAALYGVCSVGGKLLILNASPMFAAMFLFSLYGPLLTILLTVSGKVSFKALTAKPGLGIIIGLMIFAEIICHNLAISMIAAAYMVTIKRMAGIFSVIYGWLLFREHGIKYRLVGTVIMTGGAVVIALWA